MWLNREQTFGLHRRILPVYRVSVAILAACIAGFSLFIEFLPQPPAATEFLFAKLANVPGTFVFCKTK